MSMQNPSLFSTPWQALFFILLSYTVSSVRHHTKLHLTQRSVTDKSIFICGKTRQLGQGTADFIFFKVDLLASFDMSFHWPSSEHSESIVLPHLSSPLESRPTPLAAALSAIRADVFITPLHLRPWQFLIRTFIWAAGCRPELRLCYFAAAWWVSPFKCHACHISTQTLGLPVLFEPTLLIYDKFKMTPKRDTSNKRHKIGLAVNLLSFIPAAV